MTPIALVTGANRGIGNEVATQLAQHGHHVLVGARDRSRGAAACQAIAKAGGHATAVTLDIADPTSIAEGPGG